MLAPDSFLGNSSKLKFLASVDVLFLIRLLIWSIYAYACLLKCSAKRTHFSFHIVHNLHEFLHSRRLMVALPCILLLLGSRIISLILMYRPWLNSGLSHHFCLE
jgi:hypothetical protein